MPDFTKGKWFYEPKSGYIRSEHDGTYVAHIVGAGCEDKRGEEAQADARLIATAPEMYRLLEEFCKIHDMKAHSKREDNSPAFMMALVAEDGAVNMARELLARIDGKENSHD
ncbi:MAG: hypothetical protein IJG36_05220 [Synergistaceae bacterium]|nr:hypothetical protein [Synergistaceae bacterium]